MESQRTTQKGNCGHRTYRNILSLDTLVDIDHKRHGHQGSTKKDDGRKQVEIVSHIERHVHTHEQGQACTKHEEPCVSHEFEPSEHTAEPPMAPEGYRGAVSHVNSDAHCKRPVRATGLAPESTIPTIARASVSSYNSTGLQQSGAAEWCSGSTGEFGSLSPGSIPGSAARFIHPVNRLPNLAKTPGLSLAEAADRPHQAI